MKRSLRILVLSMLIIGISLSLFAAGTKESAQEGPKVINVWSFTDEVPLMLERYKVLHPEFAYEIKSTIIATTDGAYQPALDQALMGNAANAPDRKSVV